MSTRSTIAPDATRCPDCGAFREHPGASCDLCSYDPDRFVSQADTTWSDGSPATRLYIADPCSDPLPAEPLPRLEPTSTRGWGWLITLAVLASAVARSCS